MMCPRQVQQMSRSQSYVKDDTTHAQKQKECFRATSVSCHGNKHTDRKSRVNYSGSASKHIDKQTRNNEMPREAMSGILSERRYHILL